MRLLCFLLSLSLVALGCTPDAVAPSNRIEAEMVAPPDDVLEQLMNPRTTSSALTSSDTKLSATKTYYTEADPALETVTKPVTDWTEYEEKCPTYVAEPNLDLDLVDPYSWAKMMKVYDDPDIPPKDLGYVKFDAYETKAYVPIDFTVSITQVDDRTGPSEQQYFEAGGDITVAVPAYQKYVNAITDTLDSEGCL